jgi:hypothetical protein
MGERMGRLARMGERSSYYKSENLKPRDHMGTKEII